MLQPDEGTTAVDRKPRIEVVRVGAEHVDALADFFREVWEPEATAEHVLASRAAAAATNPVEPGADVPAFVFLSDDRVLGYISTIPIRVWNGTAEHAAHWMKGFMVRPESRNGPIGYLVLKEALRHLDLALVLTVAAPSRRLFAALGFRDHGALGNHITLLRPAAVFRAINLEALGLDGLPAWAPRAVRVAQRSGLATLGGWSAGAALALWKTARSTSARGFVVRTGFKSAGAAELNALWLRVRGGLAAASVRDGAYLPWRYASDNAYELATIRHGTELLGLAVVRRPRDEGDPRLRGIKVATLSDLLFPVDRPDVALATLAAAEQVARRFGADALLCSASHPAITSMLPRRGYVALSGNVHFLVRDPKGARGLPAALADWWLTRGDANSDDVF